jgi:YggT family protein
MILLLNFIAQILGILEMLIVIVAIMSWLISFNVINAYNNVVRTIWDALNALIDPLLRPIRRHLPAMGGLDLSPLVLILIIEFIVKVIIPNIENAIVS